MLKGKAIRRYVRQTLAITEKDLFLELRVKTNIIIRLLNPVIDFLVLVFIFGAIFKTRAGVSIGYWNESNFLLFLLIGFNLQFTRSIISKYNKAFQREKYWKTLSATMVAPVHRFTLLFGTLGSEMIIISVPFIIILVITLILYPIPLIYIFLVLLIFGSISLIFASIGLIISVFGISNEKHVPLMMFIVRIMLLFSCTNYPKEIFPVIIRNIIILNPFYYIFDLLRIIWYMGGDYNEGITLITLLHIIIIFSFTLSSPIISIFLFNRYYKKYGIRGY